MEADWCLSTGSSGSGKARFGGAVVGMDPGEVTDELPPEASWCGLRP